MVGWNPINTNDVVKRNELASKVIFRPNFSAQNPPIKGATNAPKGNRDPIQESVSSFTSSFRGLMAVLLEVRTGIIEEVHPIAIPPIKLEILTGKIVSLDCIEPFYTHCHDVILTDKARNYLFRTHFWRYIGI